MMNCREYLSLYSELLDERLHIADAMRCRAHAESCPSCARYDRVMRKGLRLVRELPEVSPSPDFPQRLQHRLFHVQDELARRGRFATPGAALALAIAGVIAFAAWSPMLRAPEPGQARGSVIRTAAEPAAPEWNEAERQELPRAEPMRPVPWWYGESPHSVFSYASLTGYSTTSVAPTSATLFPGPYSPLIVSPPRVRQRGGSALARYSE